MIIKNNQINAGTLKIPVKTKIQTTIIQTPIISLYDFFFSIIHCFKHERIKKYPFRFYVFKPSLYFIYMISEVPPFVKLRYFSLDNI